MHSMTRLKEVIKGNPSPYEYEQQAISEAYRAIKKLCYECYGDCDTCKVSTIRQLLVRLNSDYK